MDLTTEPQIHEVSTLKDEVNNCGIIADFTAPLLIIDRIPR